MTMENPGLKGLMDYSNSLGIIYWHLSSHKIQVVSLNFSSSLRRKRAQYPVAVSSTARPWIDVFALPEKSNMAVTESDPDPKVRKMSITFYWLCDLWAERAGMELKCYWLKKIYFRPDYSLIYSDMTAQRNIPRFCTRTICGWSLFHPLGLGIQ